MKQIFMIESSKGLSAQEIHGCIEDMTMSEENEILGVREIFNEVREGISKEMENELYSFVVDTNQEYALVNAIKGNDKLKEQFEKWFQIKDDEDD